jgi:N-acetylglucosamine-6-phosphate deacetylase
VWVEGNLVETGRAARIEVVGRRIAQVQVVEGELDRWVSAGLVDLQVNGYGGFDANAARPSAGEVRGMVERLWQHGVTSLCPTVVTAGEVEMRERLRAIAGACQAHRLVAHSVPCIHVEGPAISPEDGPRGAHDVEHVRPPSLAELDRWQESAGGRVGIVTLAPEWPGTPQYIAAARAASIVVAIGHTAASREQIGAAVDAGASLSTHLGNGAHATLERLHNYIWEQLAEDRLSASLIFDGHHLPPAVMKVMLRAKGLRRVVLVSDSVALAGSPPGAYETPVGSAVVLSADGSLRRRGTPYLAGSAGCLLDGVNNAMRHAGLSVRDAVSLATLRPATIIGRPGRAGLRPGADADLVVFDRDPRTGALAVVSTVVAGDPVYRRP